ncbi:phosphatidate cytidylyltransferase [Longibacter salinarum]|uniref:Phosphatidate cytidylyltransferase n=1 Tax=Longibacter salinarum TaxID=1850348 RepID=A0A2A8CWF6_9BACT|nr:phosphatidate cytidylyltransferase [Longibacter salinarum]PEN12941.1 phosphatidate cytidylyltransferase [Longibacter salinarum]
MSDSLRRVLTALVAAPVVLGLAYLGGWPFAVLIAGIGMVAQSEIFDIARSSGVEPYAPIGYLLGALIVAGVMIPELWAVAIAVIVGFISLAPFLVERGGFLANVMVTLASALYPTGLLAALVTIREGRGPLIDDLGAFFVVMLIFFLVWATDIFALYTGKAIGRTKLAPSISPNKTWEGSVGGVLAAGLVAIGFKLTGAVDLAWVHLAAMVVICGVVSQAGDLAESQIKRSAGVKDASSILPGHGGLFDRFDSMVVAAPLAYLYLVYVAKVFII